MMYTSPMQKTSGASRWWDWPSVALLFVLVETTATRLVATDWVPFLYLGQTVAYIAFTVGAALGYTRFSPRLARWLSFVYMLIFLPLQWTLMIDQQASLEEQFLSVGGRLLVSYSDLFSRRPVEDPIFFITLITLGFWIIGSSAGFQLVRKQNYLGAVVPSAAALLVIQNYDNLAGGRVWFVAFFAFVALLLLGRLHLLVNKQGWRERRVFLSPDDNFDLTNIMAIAAGLIILVSWIPPASAAGVNTAIQTWNRLTQPWRDFTERMENAVSALKSPVGGTGSEFYGPELTLGQGFPLEDTIMFRVQTPDPPGEEKPPRFYWRGRTYDYFEGNLWYTTGSFLEAYSPSERLAAPLAPEASEVTRFVFQTGDLPFSLVYAPSQPVWFSRQGSIRALPADGSREIIAWYANPSLLGGETYQIDAILDNPDIGQLRRAGQDYPAWIVERYLQLPDDLSPRIVELAEEIASSYYTPFDKAAAITRYLRDNIEYADTLPQAPRDRDPLEWMLFENKQAYCVYYASAEILMLRSLGIPARMAVGFAEGERDEEENLYVVRQKNAHAWPEVYFPGVGWVEFEPTGNQPALNRPLPPRNNNDDLGILDREPAIPDLLENPREDFRGLQDDEGVIITEQTETRTVNPSLYLIPFLIAFAALTVYFSRRYSMPERAPGFLRAAYERVGAQTPAWVVNWERWTNAPPIEKAFESVNFSLRLLDKPMPIHATPIERAEKLKNLLPKAEKEIGALLDEHQTSLYTSRIADVLRAQRAARRLRWQAVRERLRYALEGRPIQSL